MTMLMLCKCVQLIHAHYLYGIHHTLAEGAFVWKLCGDAGHFRLHGHIIPALSFMG